MGAGELCSSFSLTALLCFIVEELSTSPKLGHGITGCSVTPLHWPQGFPCDITHICWCQYFQHNAMALRWSQDLRYDATTLCQHQDSHKGLSLTPQLSSARGLARPHHFCVHGARPRWPHRSLPVVCSPVATTSTFSSYGLRPNVTIHYHCAAAVPFATTTTSRATTAISRATVGFLCYHRYFKATAVFSATTVNSRATMVSSATTATSRATGVFLCYQGCDPLRNIPH